MSLLFSLEALATGTPVNGIQRGQRDFSTYLMHLTRFSAMSPVRDCVEAMAAGSDGMDSAELTARLQRADTASLRTLNRIFRAGVVEAREFHVAHPEAVCLTECTLPGILSHAARYGRFGLLFEKRTIVELGGRPVAYVGIETLRRARARAKDGGDDAEDFRFLNLYRPENGHFQDYTHEREWRSPVSIPVREAVAVLVATPGHVPKVRRYTDLPVLPLTLLYELGI